MLENWHEGDATPRNGVLQAVSAVGTPVQTDLLARAGILARGPTSLLEELTTLRGVTRSPHGHHTPTSASAKNTGCAP